jgi:hypothetical protein
MLVRNLRRPGDAARAQLAYNDQLRIEIANDNRISKIRENQKKGFPELPTQEQQLNLSERIGDVNQRRQKSFDNLSQVFAPDQVDRIMPLLDDNAFQFLNVYWKDMKSDLTKKVDAKLMDELYFQGYFNKYMNSIMDQKGLNAPTGTQTSVNEIEELLALFSYKDEAKKVFDRMTKVDTPASRELGYILTLIPDRRRIDRIRSLPDAEKQRVISSLSDVFRGINPDPTEWNKALQQSSNQSFYSASVPLFRNMTEAQKQSAQETVDYMNDPLGTLGPDVFPYEAVRPKLGPVKPGLEAPKARRPAAAAAAAVEVVGTPKGTAAEARLLGESDYIPAVIFETSTKAEQDKYITLLRKVLTVSTKNQLFGKKAKNPAKTNSASYYTSSNKDSDERTIFTARLRDYGLDRNIKDELDALPKKEGIGMKRKPGRPKSGKGIASTCKEQTPRWIELGRYRINGRLLDEKQLLSVRYQSGTAVPLFPKMIPISDAFHELLTNLFETKKLDKRLLKELDPEEQRSAEALLVKSGVGRGFGIKEITPTDEEAKKIKRFEIVNGSYLAGNNAPAVIHELRSLIIHFVTTGHLSRKEGLRTLVELQ